MKEKNYAWINILKCHLMVMVMLIHYIGMAGFWNAQHEGMTKILGMMINLLLSCCVPVFFIITGYLDKTYSYEKVLKKILYIVSVYLMYCIPLLLVYRFKYNDQSWSIYRYLTDVLNIDGINCREGFIRQYIIMILFAPLINSFFDKVTVGAIRKYICGIVFVFGVMRSLEYWFSFTTMFTEPTKYMWSIMCFCIGNWIRREHWEESKKSFFISTIICIIILLLNVLIFGFFNKMDSGYYFCYNRLGCILTAVFLFLVFMTFRNVKINGLYDTNMMYSFISKASLDAFLGAIVLEYLFYDMNVAGKTFYYKNIGILIFNFIILCIIRNIRKCIWDRYFKNCKGLLVLIIVIITITSCMIYLF